MLFGSDPGHYRRFFRQAWEKRQQGAPLEPLERLVAEVVALHPEYHAALGEVAAPPAGDAGNPFLHMGMHIALQEQLGADRPAGIRDLYRRIAARAGDGHDGEHRMMECLGLALWEAQRSGAAPDEKAYLECLRRLAGG